MCKKCDDRKKKKKLISLKRDVENTYNVHCHKQGFYLY